MSSHIRIYIGMVLAGGGILAIVFSFPALTSGGNAAGVDAPREEVEVVIAQERAYCERQPEAMDCRCFAEVSGVIMLNAAPQVRGARYADREELARGQAASKC